MKWNDFRNEFNDADIFEKMELIESGELSDIEILRKFLNPKYYNYFTKEEIWDALCVLTALYCDEHEDMMNLEKALEKRVGTQICEEICESSVPEMPCDRLGHILEKYDSMKKAKMALEYLDELGDYYD